MTLRSYGLDPVFPEAIDSSMLKDFVDCPSLFYLRHVLGLKKRYRGINFDDAKFDWGTLWHKMHEVYDKTSDVSASLALLNNFPKTIDPATDRHGRSPQRMAKLFFEYLERYKQDREDYEILRNEQFFDVYNEEVDLRWIGRIDKIVRHSSGKVRVWDHKTASRMGDTYFDSHEHGFQFPGYVWSVNNMLTEPVYEVVLDVVYCLKTKHDFFRRTFRYTREELNEWVDNVKRILERMYYLRDNHLDDPNAWTKNWNHCTKWGRCTFADVHWTPAIGDTRLRILRDDYHEERWDPRVQEDDET